MKQPNLVGPSSPYIFHRGERGTRSTIADDAYADLGQSGPAARSAHGPAKRISRSLIS
jgi:hypothetical protein